MLAKALTEDGTSTGKYDEVGGWRRLRLQQGRVQQGPVQQGPAQQRPAQ
jgi:hypothetical protein